MQLRVDDVMTIWPRTCRVVDTLDQAAQILWEDECGCVPVIDGEQRIVGMLTDRDVSIAAFVQEKRLKDILVTSAMTSDVRTCGPTDPLSTAKEIMKEAKVRRLPVVDELGRVLGIVSLTDIVREAARERRLGRRRVVTDKDVCELVSAFCGPVFADRSLPREATREGSLEGPRRLT